jgi:hypothetical protein
VVSSPFFPSKLTRRSSNVLRSVADSMRSRALALSRWSSPAIPCVNSTER